MALKFTALRSSHFSNFYLSFSLAGQVGGAKRQKKGFILEFDERVWLVMRSGEREKANLINKRYSGTQRRTKLVSRAYFNHSPTPSSLVRGVTQRRGRPSGSPYIIFASIYISTLTRCGRCGELLPDFQYFARKRDVEAQVWPSK